jgi:hypothetical protein
MRKASLILSFLLITIVLVGIAGAAYAQHDNTVRVERAQALVRDLQQIAIGKSDYQVAEAIAKKYGNAPPPYWTRVYPKEDCAAGHFEGCGYTIEMNDSPLYRWVLKDPSLRYLGVREWWGNALIQVSNGIVKQYAFWVWYRASNGQWRGFGEQESNALPKYEPFQDRISDSYSVLLEPLDITQYESGFGLRSSLTPAASAAERQRALHLDLACLDKKESCGDLHQVMPDAWQDFCARWGHLDVERHGHSYPVCREPTR